MKATGNESRAKMTGAKETGAKATGALDKQDTVGKGDRLMGEKVDGQYSTKCHDWKTFRKTD